MTTPSSVTSTIISATLSTVLPGYGEYVANERLHKGWTSPSSLPTKLLSGDPSTILLALLVTLSLPVLLHIYFYTQASRNPASGGDGVPTFVLLGPSNAGKTSLVTLLQGRMIVAAEKSADELDVSRGDKEELKTNGVNGSAAKTHHSQISYTVGLHLPPATPLGSNKYRSANDPEVLRANKVASPYKLIDTPGHGKLRSEHALTYLSPTNKNVNLAGVIFMLDSTSHESSDSSAAKDTVSWLHDVLLALQRRRRNTTKKQANDFPVLIAANKQDLFTALPPLAIKQQLERELERVRTSRKKGISAVDSTPEKEEEEDEVTLGGGGEGSFSFKMLEEDFGLAVDVLGGTVKGEDSARGVGKWEAWIGSCL